MQLKKCGYGGTGRRVRLRGVWETIRVQVPVTAPVEKRGQKYRKNGVLPSIFIVW